MKWVNSLSETKNYVTEVKMKTNYVSTEFEDVPELVGDITLKESREVLANYILSKDLIFWLKNMMESEERLEKPSAFTIKAKKGFEELIETNTDRLKSLFNYYFELNSLNSLNKENIVGNKEQYLYIEETSKNILQAYKRENDVECSFSALSIPVTYEHLFVILQELLINAAKFSDKGQKISVKTEIINNKIALEVRDFGIGMNEALTEQIQTFDYLGKAEFGNRLGLLIVSQIVQLYDGKLEIFSIPMHGTVVTLRFPIKND
jgi:signal transduction histidine kinase